MGSWSPSEVTTGCRLKQKSYNIVKFFSVFLPDSTLVQFIWEILDWKKKMSSFFVSLLLKTFKNAIVYHWSQQAYKMSYISVTMKRVWEVNKWTFLMYRLENPISFIDTVSLPQLLLVLLLKCLTWKCHLKITLRHWNYLTSWKNWKCLEVYIPFHSYSYLPIPDS